MSTTNLFFSKFSEHLDSHYGHPNALEKEQIRKSDKRIRRLDSLARLIVRGDSENCAAVALAKNTWYFTANEYASVDDNIHQILQALEKVTKNKNGDITKTKHAREYLLKTYLAPVEKPRIRKRLMRDVKKFLKSLKTYEVFSKVEIGKLLSGEYFYWENPKKIHAEICLLSGLVVDNNHCSFTAVFGISKLCCKLCAAAMFAIKETYKLNISFRGRHGNFYFAWIPSSLLLNECFSKFVGDEASQLYSHANGKKKKKITVCLKDLDGHREVLKKYFYPERGNVKLDSDSSSPSNTSETASPTIPVKLKPLAVKFKSKTASSTAKTASSEDTSSDERESEYPDDSSSDEESRTHIIPIKLKIFKAKS